jgi:hypothetical protein
MATTRSESRPSILGWALALGGAGFAAGFFGPIALNPEANQGPLVGLLITGPFGALGGLVLGTLFRYLRVSDSVRRRALASACALLGLGTLFFCLPEPALRGYVIDAEIEDCAPPAQGFAAALATWEQAVARTTWTTPPADWRDVARRNVEQDAGVVLTLRVARRSAIYEHRKPWNAGEMTAGAWLAVEQSERYYAREAGRSCASYLARSRALYAPSPTRNSGPNEPADVWPPTDTTGFLALLELKPMPTEYRRLLQ